MVSSHEVSQSLLSTAHSTTCVKRPLSKSQKIGFQDQLSLNEGHAILSTFIKLPFVIKIIVLSIFSDCFTQDTRYLTLLHAGNLHALFVFFLIIFFRSIIKSIKQYGSRLGLVFVG